MHANQREKKNAIRVHRVHSRPVAFTRRRAAPESNRPARWSFEYCGGADRPARRLCFDRRANPGKREFSSRALRAWRATSSLRMAPAPSRRISRSRKQLVEHFQIQLQLLVLAPADGFRVRNPSAERRSAGRDFQQRQHGGAAPVVDLEIERDSHARAARRQRDAARRVIERARGGELLSFRRSKAAQTRTARRASGWSAAGRKRSRPSRSGSGARAALRAS